MLVWEFFLLVFCGVVLVVVLFDVYCDLILFVDFVCIYVIIMLYFVLLMLVVWLVILVVYGLVFCCVFISGEVFDVELCDCFYVMFNVELYNFYGFMEVVVDVSWWFVGLIDVVCFVLIGFLVWNICLYVLDVCLCLLLLGVIGELYLGGV